MKRINSLEKNSGNNQFCNSDKDYSTSPVENFRRLSLGAQLKQDIKDIWESNDTFIIELMNIFVKTIENYCYSVHLLINSQNSSCAKLFTFNLKWQLIYHYNYLL